MAQRFMKIWPTPCRWRTIGRYAVEILCLPVAAVTLIGVGLTAASWLMEAALFCGPAALVLLLVFFLAKRE